MDKPIYEIPIVESVGLRPRIRERANDAPAEVQDATEAFAAFGSSGAGYPAPGPLAAPAVASAVDASTVAAPTVAVPSVAVPTVSFAAPTGAPVAVPVYAAPTGSPVEPDIQILPPVSRAARPAAAFEEEFDEDEPILAPATADRALIDALSEVLRTRASDLHLTSNAPPMLRVDGGLRPIEGSEIWDTERVRGALYSLLTDHQKAIFEKELELDFAYTVTANARFRVNFYQQRSAVGAAFRIIPTEIKTLKDLGVPDTVSEFSKLARGLVLVTGPTGSGKSTTLAALIDLVNRTRADHIVTVEDPIEFMHNNHRSLVNQREVGHDTHSFAAALKHVLRQDPDVILVGELRDLETISVALTAAETGHLVFATLHTQDAAQTIDRVIDVFPPHQQGQVRAQLAATLQGVVCQTLVKRASGKGRVVATEVLVTTPAVANLVREGKTYQIASAMQAGRDLGMYTMDQHLAELVDSGTITYSAGLDKAHDVEGFKRLVHREDPGAGSATNNMSAGMDFGDSYSSAPVAGRTI
ncbi:MAG: hypothetical protein RI885_2120 [Actinomycetota bacterium]|jgi:twitching motility protein PilT